MSRRCETGVHSLGVHCHCFDVRQRASADSHVCFRRASASRFTASIAGSLKPIYRLSPPDKSAIQAITPSQIYAWEGLPPDVNMTDYTEARLPSEEKWYALTGRVVEAKVEADGDIHLALQDAEDNKVGTVNAEIPVGPKWCEIRQGVFAWTTQKFPFSVKSVHDVTIAEHVVTVTGKAFYDFAHAPADHSNRRHSPKDYAVWEIHPVMKMEVVQ